MIFFQHLKVKFALFFDTIHDIYLELGKKGYNAMVFKFKIFKMSAQTPDIVWRILSWKLLKKLVKISETIEPSQLLENLKS